MDRNTDYKKDSLSLWGAVSMGTGVMIGAGIFAITGQMAEAAGEWFPWAFLVAGLVAGLTSYTYVSGIICYLSVRKGTARTGRFPKTTILSKP